MLDNDGLIIIIYVILNDKLINGLRFPIANWVIIVNWIMFEFIIFNLIIIRVMFRFSNTMKYLYIDITHTMEYLHIDTTENI